LNPQDNNDNLVELLDEEFETNGRDSDSLRAAAKTWAISFKQIRRQNELAGDLLSLISMFNHQHILEELLVDYFSHAYGQEKSLELVRAIGVLKAFSIVSGAQDNSISMHRLIQLVLRRWLIQESIMETFLLKAIMTIRRVSGPILEGDIGPQSRPDYQSRCDYPVVLSFSPCFSTLFSRI
jgi:hypothetical protein